MTEPQKGSCKPNVVYTSINTTNKFAASTDIRFNQNLDEKSYLSGKIEAVKHLYADFSENNEIAPMTSCRRRRPVRLNRVVVYVDVI